jgi:hypothetical protein
MEPMMTFLMVALGFAIRLGVPVLVTVLAVWLLKRLDARWQAEADQMSAAALQRALAQEPHCWEINNCAPERRAGCIAYQKQNAPCWQHYRTPDGKLREACVGCKVFKQAPVPVVA